MTPEEALQYLHDLPDTFSGPLTVVRIHWNPSGVFYRWANQQQAKDQA